MDVRVEEVRPMRVAFVRHTGPYAGCGAAWGRLCTWAGSRRLIGPSSTFLGVCHDDPEVTPPEKIRYDACVTVSDAVDGAGSDADGGGDGETTLDLAPPQLEPGSLLKALVDRVVDVHGRRIPNLGVGIQTTGLAQTPDSRPACPGFMQVACRCGGA